MEVPDFNLKSFVFTKNNRALLQVHFLKNYTTLVSVIFGQSFV